MIDTKFVLSGYPHKNLFEVLIFKYHKKTGITAFHLQFSIIDAVHRSLTRAEVSLSKKKKKKEKKFSCRLKSFAVLL